jgi:hypothetical protein
MAPAFAVLILPRFAEACPQCASQQAGGVARIVALGLMMLLPFGVAFVVFGALRRASKLVPEREMGRAATAGSEPAGGMPRSR